MESCGGNMKQFMGNWKLELQGMELRGFKGSEKELG